MNNPLLHEALSSWLLTYGLDPVLHTTVCDSEWYKRYVSSPIGLGSVVEVANDGWLEEEQIPYPYPKGSYARTHWRLTPKALAFIRGETHE